MNHDAPHILLINPWIHDFAAYDVWAKPLGLLYLAAILRAHGFRVSYVDCLDRFHPNSPKTDVHQRNGRGPYLKTSLPNPAGLEDIPRHFSRYGIWPSWLRQDLSSLARPDLILVTSLMTYWYPGVVETIAVVKEFFPSTPLWVGGIYATLCQEHAETHLSADRVLPGAVEAQLVPLVAECTGFNVEPVFDPGDLNTYPYPALDLQRQIPYVPLLTSKGCPFTCAYCASHFLFPGRLCRDPEQVAEEIEYWHRKFHVRDFAFYDDALLMDAETHALPLLNAIVRRNLPVTFHTPNALHIRNIEDETARLMFEAGFDTIRLGLETAQFHQRSALDVKVTEAEFKWAATCLKNAGFQKNQIGTYLLMGLPGQPLSDVETSIRIVKDTGLTPILAHYTPIPHTRMWPQAVAASRYDLNKDPIFTNNALMPCHPEGFSWKLISDLKRLIQD